MPAARELSLFDLLCLGVNAIVGSGIYLFPGTLAALLGPAAFLAFALSGLTSLLVAFCFAETAGMFDRSGGPYVYARAAFGAPTGYLVGWTCWAAAVLSWAAVARALVEQLAFFWPQLTAPAASTAVAIAVTLVLGAINYAGLKPGAYTTDALTVAKLLPLLVLTVVGLFRSNLSRLTPFAPRGMAALPRGTFIAFFAFQGFEVVPVPAGESSRPRRNIPLAVLGSVLGTTVLYVLIQLVATASTPDLAGATQPLSRMGQALLGKAGAQLVTAAAAVSMLGFCAGVALASPRYLEALAIDRFLPEVLAARHPVRGTPHWAIALTSALTCGFVALFDFSRLVDLSVLTVSVQYLATCAAIPRLRRQMEAHPGAFRLPFGVLVPLMAILVVVALMVAQLISPETDAWATFAGFGVLLAIGGVPGLAAWARRRG